MSFSIEGVDTELRTALVIENKTISEHSDLVCGLKSKFNHTIRPVERPGDGTCTTYALNLLETYRPLVKELQDRKIRPGREFMSWLVDENRLAEIPAIREGELIFYFREGEWQHVGIATSGGRVVSKWGTYAVFCHGISEVPASYGDDIRSFVRPTPRTSASLLFEFACAETKLNKIEVDRLRAATGIGELF